jgi:hypothetical protein
MYLFCLFVPFVFFVAPSAFLRLCAFARDHSLIQFSEPVAVLITASRAGFGRNSRSNNSG